MNFRQLTPAGTVADLEIATQAVRPPTREFFVAAADLRLASPSGLVTVHTGDHVVVSETGTIEVFTADAFAAKFVVPVEPATPPASPPAT